MARRRNLTPDEAELWHQVARTARPLHKHAPLPEDPTAPPQAEPPKPAPHPLPPFRVGQSAQRSPAHNLAPGPAEVLAAQPLRMDARTHTRMTRGKLAPEARIDLHGMTLVQAHSELIHFILNAQSDGLRLVLVITGKGKPGADHGPMPSRIGALRHQVPHWLHLPPLGPAVQQVVTAHLRHGGTGALYVYLRRR